VSFLEVALERHKEMREAADQAEQPEPPSPSTAAKLERSRAESGGAISWQQTNLIVAFCGSAFLSGCLSAHCRALLAACSRAESAPPRAASMLAPILPERLDSLGAGPLMSGAIFGAYPFTNAIVSLFVPSMIDSCVLHAQAPSSAPLSSPQGGPQAAAHPRPGR